MGFAKSVIGGYSQASAYDAKKRQALISGEMQQRAAYAQAMDAEQATKKNLRVVGENMARQDGNKRREAGAARAGAAASGFAPEGSATKGEELVAKAYRQAMNDMARSGSQASMNALNEQIALRRGGDVALQTAQNEAQQYAAMARMTRVGAFMSAIGGVAGAAGGAGSAYAAGGDWRTVAGHAITGANAGSGLVSAFNPFMVDFAPEDWDKYYLDMLGIGKRK